MKDAALKKKERQDMILQMHNNTTEIKTPISAKDADHSFNGIIFDVVSKKNHQVHLSLRLKGLYIYIVVISVSVEWCIKKRLSSSITSYSSTSISYNYHTNNNTSFNP